MHQCNGLTLNFFGGVRRRTRAERLHWGLSTLLEVALRHIVGNCQGLLRAGSAQVMTVICQIILFVGA